MKIAVLSDIHSNFVALKACLDFLKADPSIDHVIFLGDYVTDGPYPEKTLDLIYEAMADFPCTLLSGNREEYLLKYEHTPHPWKRSSGSGALLYTIERIRPQDWEFFHTLNNHAYVSLTDPSTGKTTETFLIAHGSQFHSRDNIWANPERGDVFLKDAPVRLMIGGHTHHQQCMEKFGTLYVNPGSVGLGITGKSGHTQFCVVEIPAETDLKVSKEPGALQKSYTDSGRFADIQVHNYTIPYDVREYLQAIKKSGEEEYAPYLVKGIKDFCCCGENCYIDVIHEVSRIVGGDPSTAPEEVWAEAYAKKGRPEATEKIWKGKSAVAERKRENGQMKEILLFPPCILRGDLK